MLLDKHLAYFAESNLGELINPEIDRYQNA